MGDPAYTIIFEELKRLGYVEGVNLTVDRYSAEGRFKWPRADVVASRDPHCVGTVLSPMVEQSRAKVSSYAIRGWGLSRRFLLCESCFQPRDVFQEALVVFEHALAGQDEEIIAELLITLKVDFKQPFVSYGQDLSVFYALDRHGSSVIRRKEAKFSDDASWRMDDANFLDQKLSRDGEKHFGGLITLP